MTVSQFLLKTVSGGDGEPSSMRVLTTFMCVLFIPSIAFSLIWTTIYHPEYMVDLVIPILMAVLGALGIKVWQFGKEVPTQLVQPSTVTETETNTKVTDVK